METFLIPIDYTDKSLKALEVAFSLASRIEAQLLLCHVFQPPVITGDENEPMLALPKHGKATALAHMQEKAGQQMDSVHPVRRSEKGTQSPVKFQN